MVTCVNIDAVKLDSIVAELVLSKPTEQLHKMFHTRPSVVIVMNTKLVAPSSAISCSLTIKQSVASLNSSRFKVILLGHPLAIYVADISSCKPTSWKSAFV
mmetsp:Transcript_9677/g.14632  ORF Transcript_9677/g.14632 Transcript_9677/m.14632 type:complete len:101 (-) Transcript_9677:1093-1395(-)